VASLGHIVSVPVLVAVDQDQGALEDVEAQLTHRYERDYRVESLRDPAEAHGKLAQLARAGEEVALVLAGESLLHDAGGELLDQARQLHPRAKRGLVVTGGAWENRPKADAILDAMALGRVDYYVPRPTASPDEVFHQTIASVLLEWATERRMVPHTVHIVGETWSGRAFDLREVFARCAVPHA
jgi:thioredoxin reductase (NADPH)